MTKEQIETAMEDMDVPVMRRDLSKLENVRWLIRNIWIRNGDHPRISEVIRELGKLGVSML